MGIFCEIIIILSMKLKFSYLYYVIIHHYGNIEKYYSNDILNIHKSVYHKIQSSDNHFKLIVDNFFMRHANCVLLCSHLFIISSIFSAYIVRLRAFVNSFSLTWKGMFSKASSIFTFIIKSSSSSRIMK